MKNDFQSKWEKREFWFQFFKNEENQRYFDFIESCKNKNYSETTIPLRSIICIISFQNIC